MTDSQVQGYRLVSRARALGVTFELDTDGALMVMRSELLTSALASELHRHRADVVAALQDEREYHAALRRWLPILGWRVRVKDSGRVGLVCGITLGGVSVQFGTRETCASVSVIDPRNLERDW